MNPVEAYLGLGANLGDRLANLRDAVTLLGDQGDVTVMRSSRVYETTAVGGPSDRPDYLNAVIQLRTTLSAHELLDACNAVESELGRVRDERWGPRTIDIDVLTYGDERIDDERLTVPH
ncbi:MAG: 2-amino-4-hydroxy-6-hydroxymethyldihydropteridine diphosphokinase, partial [Actinomycetota bacterium]